MLLCPDLIVNDRSIKMKETLKKRSSKTSIHRKLTLTLVVTLPYGKRNREKRMRNMQKPATALGRQAKENGQKEYGRISMIIENDYLAT